MVARVCLSGHSILCNKCCACASTQHPQERYELLQSLFQAAVAHSFGSGDALLPYYRVVMGQVPSFDQRQICLCDIASGCLPSWTESGVMRICQCPVWNTALNLPWKSHPLPLDSTIPLGGSGSRELAPAESHLHTASYTALNISTAVQAARSNWYGRQPKVSSAAWYQGITWRVLQTTSLPILLSPLSNI